MEIFVFGKIELKLFLTSEKSVFNIYNRQGKNFSYDQKRKFIPKRMPTIEHQSFCQKTVHVFIKLP